LVILKHQNFRKCLRNGNMHEARINGTKWLSSVPVAKLEGRIAVRLPQRGNQIAGEGMIDSLRNREESLRRLFSYFLWMSFVASQDPQTRRLSSPAVVVSGSVWRRSTAAKAKVLKKFWHVVRGGEARRDSSGSSQTFMSSLDRITASPTYAVPQYRKTIVLSRARKFA